VEIISALFGEKPLFRARSALAYPMAMCSRYATTSMKALCILGTLLLLAVVGGSGAAQGQGRPPPPPPKRAPPPVTVTPNDIYRGPPAPPERYIAPPRSGQGIAPPMPRPEPLPQMSPRIGN
jgi:hypothetical protein